MAVQQTDPHTAAIRSLLKIKPAISHADLLTLLKTKTAGDFDRLIELAEVLDDEVHRNQAIQKTLFGLAAQAAESGGDLL